MIGPTPRSHWKGRFNMPRLVRKPVARDSLLLAYGATIHRQVRKDLSTRCPFTVSLLVTSRIGGRTKAAPVHWIEPLRAGGRLQRSSNSATTEKLD